MASIDGFVFIGRSGCSELVDWRREKFMPACTLFEKRSALNNCMNLELAKRRKIVSTCETQPLTVFGLEKLLNGTADLEFGSAHNSPAEWLSSPEAAHTDILIIDKGL